MKILAFDTSAYHTTIAILENKNRIDEIIDYNKFSHNKTLITYIRTLLERNGLKISDIDLLVAGSGPGSFTGLRVGISTIKAISYGLGKPFKGVSSLDSIALKFAFEEKILSGSKIRVFYDGRQKDLFTADYVYRNGMVEKISDITIIPYGNINSENVDYICGYTDDLDFPKDFRNNILPDANYIAFIGLDKFDGKSEPYDFEPSYYKNFTIRG
ncbi:MAG: tRNA (adenosine(37)-N6)-threonylcarbamoyltransferase complex dimerization subunit type 1 TsaB [Candidatus Cloacimonadota bacterium]|nr:MAG: tRNA (adenosine(37)-N6)-threonylcarbamoyltransferase complex dimerization subunit type 1 TsaB [Candidatus Cloacimonadota bacterium]PIE78578.1 MAG: tRNA (adenosine(37)-N6)-threonylcarbamoyltransferase complex dimerization subunit type 1 TsaB [Candidatus Delongbacteria bacterium]